MLTVGNLFRQLAQVDKDEGIGVYYWEGNRDEDIVCFVGWPDHLRIETSNEGGGMLFSVKDILTDYDILNTPMDMEIKSFEGDEISDRIDQDPKTGYVSLIIA